MKKWPFILLLLGSVSACKPESKENTASPKPAPTATQAATASTSAKVYPWKLPETPAPNEAVAYGEKLIAQTATYLGPDVEDVQMRYTGNHLSCKSCHLEAGKKRNALGFVGVASRYPTFRGRENREADLKDRINGCMERSMNGKPLPKESKEMNAMVAYMEWLSEGIPRGAKVEGLRTPEIELLDRAADPVLGKTVFEQKCQVCHQANGQGLPLNPQNLSQGYSFPPLWGPDSYNNGAGMHRVITAAKYIKANMPLGNPSLTTEEAFDVAAYINNQARPEKAGLEKDYPDRSLKPVDAPFAPHADDFPLEQHQWGPFQPILDARKKSK